ncbi:hypothetical protein BH10ACI3_BH10ACI3_18250 [soil metagenome]
MYRGKIIIRFVIIINLLGILCFVADAQTCSSGAVGLVSAYSGDGNALDARSRNDGTIQGNVTYSTGEVGQGFQLGGTGNTSGVGDRVIVGNPAGLRLQDFTIEAWVQRSSSTIVTNSPFPGVPNGTFFAYGQNGYGFVIDQNTNKIGLTNVGLSVVYSNLTVTDLNWHHIAVTKSGNQVIFYIDGVADSPIAYNTTFAFTTSAAIGARGDSNAQNAFFGAVDELAIYNRSLNASEISAIFNAQTTGKCKPLATYAPDNQVMWIAGDGDTSDSSGNGNNGMLQSGAGFAVGRVGQGFSFDGIDDFVSSPSSASSNFGTGAFSIETWVNFNSTANEQVLVEKFIETLNANSTGYSLTKLSDNRIRFVFTTGAFVESAPQTLNPTTWYHFAATRDAGGAVKIYLNSVQIAIGTNSSNVNSTSSLKLGHRGNPTDTPGSADTRGFYLNGRIDETSLYNRALSADEITSIFNADLAGKYKVQSTVPANLTAWLPGDGNTNDVQGANNAILQNGATYGTGKVGQGFQFDGVDDQITVPHNVNQNGGTNISIEAWINPTTLPHGGTIFQKRTSGNIGGYVLETTQTSGSGAANGLQFVIMIGGVYRTLNPANVLTTNAWQHVAATYDGAFMRMYVNGVEVGNRAQTGAIDTSTSDVIIGRNAASPTIAFQGNIDEIALYNRALNATEIRDVYYAQSGGKYKGSINPTAGDTAKIGDVALTFAGITTAGDVHETSLNGALLPVLPAGTPTGLTYDISTSGNGTSPTACFNLPSFTAGQFANLSIYHLESGTWVNRTAPTNTYPTLCSAGLTSLSPFAIVQGAGTPTPTNTPTNTPTATPTNTPTATPTNTPTATPTNTPTATPTNTPTATPTNTPTATPTNTPTATPTNTPTATPTNTPTATPTNTPTATPTNTPTATPTNTPTATPTNTPTATPTNTPTATPTNTPTATPTNTPTATPTNTPTATPTSTPTGTPTSTPTGSPTPTPPIATVQLGSSSYLEDESQTAVIDITRTGNLAQTTTVTFQTANGSAVGGAACTTGVDYIGVPGQAVTFNPTESLKTVNVQICGDNLSEPNQTVILTITGASVGSPGLAVLTINDTATAFRNANGIVINGGGASAPYPSQITVAGGPSIIGSMRVTLYDLAVLTPDNVDVLLVGPGGQKFVLMGNSGGANPISGVTLNITDTAGQVLPDANGYATGSYEPTTWGSIAAFPAPAPTTPYNLPGSSVGGSGTQTLLGNFGGTNSNGVWSLYIREDNGVPFAPVGAFGGGWGIEFLAPTAANASISGRVLTADGSGLRNAEVTITGNSLTTPRRVTTSSFGYYSVDGLQVGETYVVTVGSKRFTFQAPSQVISLVDSVTDADFVAEP